MPDLDKLRSLGDQVLPPPLALLEDVARRRRRRAALATVGAGAAAVLVVVGGVMAVQTVGDDRSLPDPITTPTPTPQVTPSPSTPEAPPTHESETSMTPQEVVTADNAALAYAGVSADDPDFRLSVWTAECTWCPLQFEDPPTRPTFKAIAVTADGWQTTTYRRPPRGTAGIFYVHSPAQGVLLVVDPANGGEWQVRENGTWSLLPHLADERMVDSPRQWFICRLSATDRTTWCSYDPESETVHEWGEKWSGGPDDDISAVSPGVGVEPWGRERLQADTDGPLTAWWYEDGVRRTRTLVESLPVNSRAGSVLGADEGDLLYWSVARGEDRMRFFVGDDLGQSWRTIEQHYPADPAADAQVAVLATPEGNLLLRAVEERADGSRVRLWRLESLEEGDWTPVYDSGTSDSWTDNALDNPLTVWGSRLVLGTFYSDDDGRTWTRVDQWR